MSEVLLSFRAPAADVKAESTRRFGALLGEKGIRCEVDVWGSEYPHDWSSWREQFAHLLPRFV